jgi:hypothetical protein
MKGGDQGFHSGGHLDHQPLPPLASALTQSPKQEKTWKNKVFHAVPGSRSLPLGLVKKRLKFAMNKVLKKIKI